MKVARVHVNQNVIKLNMARRKPGHPRYGEELEPPITCKRGEQNVYGFEVEVAGPSKLVYRPDKPLSCGARLWLETLAPVFVDGEELA